jgi:hypothetical protein
LLSESGPGAEIRNRIVHIRSALVVHADAAARRYLASEFFGWSGCTKCIAREPGPNKSIVYKRNPSANRSPEPATG